MQERIANKRSSKISPELQEMISNLVVDVVEKNQKFNSQKKWIKKYANIEGLDAEQLVSDLEVYFDEILKKSDDYDKIREQGEAAYIPQKQTVLIIDNIIREKIGKVKKELEEAEQEQDYLEEQIKFLENNNQQNNAEIEALRKQAKKSLAWAIVFTIIFNVLFGVIAVIYASKAKTHIQNHNILECKENLRKATLFKWISVVVSALFIIFTLIT